MRRCLLPLALLLSCSAMTTVADAARRTHAPRTTQAAPPKGKGLNAATAATAAAAAGAAATAGAAAATPATPADPGTAADADLLKGLPAPWKATVLDVPLPPPAPAPQTAGKGRKPGQKAGQPGGSGSSVAGGGGSINVPATSTSRVLIPISPRMGLAAFRSGDSFVIVVDNAEPMDTSALHGDGVFSTLTVTTLPGATLLQIKLPDTDRKSVV